jgi:oligopeptide transport system substrate-binding protein
MKTQVTVFAIAFAYLFSGCGDDHTNKNINLIESDGGVYTGGVLRVNEVENIKSLMPIAINEVNSFHLSTQVYEGLVKYNQADLAIVPALAESWNVSEDGKEYTFHLRRHVKFHDDSCFAGKKGRFVNANDIKFCFENLCTKNVHNNQFDVTFKDRVAGANDYFEISATGKGKSLPGLVIENDSTVTIHLVHPDANFINILAMPGCYIYPKEAVAKYGEDMRLKCVGTGPFYIETIKEGEVIVMKKNRDYWGTDAYGNKLPYLDGLKWTFIRDKKAEVLEFRRGNLDMVYRIPVEMFHEFMGDLENAKKRANEFDIFSSTALSTHYFGFNAETNPAFAKREVRLAFNYAIDRHKIADFTIQGEGISADHGIVPYTESFENNGYDYKALRGYKYNPDTAKKLMELAGYPDGKGFPEITLEINGGGGDRNILVAEVIQKMLKENLGVTININTVSWPEHIDNMQTGKADFFRYAWISDYSDPESFLTLFYGKHAPKNPKDRSYINLCRFKNAKFDSLFTLARMEIDKNKRYKLLSQAEQVVLDEAPFMPIFYDENFRLEQKNVRNLPENPLNYMDMTTAYLVPSGKLSQIEANVALSLSKRDLATKN